MVGAGYCISQEQQQQSMKHWRQEIEVVLYARASAPQCLPQFAHVLYSAHYFEVRQGYLSDL